MSEIDQLPEFIRAKIKVGPRCWEWTAAKISSGYGVLGTNGRGTRLAHRVVYEMLREPIPPDREIHHVCENRGCVNPDHMETVTRREHIAMSAGPIGDKIRQTHCIHGHPLSGSNLHIGPKGTRICRACKARRQRESVIRKRKVELFDEQ